MEEENVQGESQVEDKVGNKTNSDSLSYITAAFIEGDEDVKVMLRYLVNFLEENEKFESGEVRHAPTKARKALQSMKNEVDKIKKNILNKRKALEAEKVKSKES